MHNEFEKRIRLFSEDDMDNWAVFGLKGTGKSKLFSDYFTLEKRMELARDMKRLFVYTDMKNKDAKTNLCYFLKSQVLAGVEYISDSDSREMLKAKMQKHDSEDPSSETMLDHYLLDLKDAGYQMIFVMDNFQLMSRNKEIGREQYAILRRENEAGLCWYWAISDTELIEKGSSQEYIDSFLEQKFIMRETVNSYNEEPAFSIASGLSEKLGLMLSDDEIRLVCKLTGGNPALIRIAMAEFSKSDLTDSLTLENCLECLLSSDGILSLLDDWLDGLTVRQKQILYTVAVAETPLDASEIDAEKAEINRLADDSGRGLLFRENKKDRAARRCWRIAVPLLEKYIRKCGESFLLEDESSDLSILSEGTVGAGNGANFGGIIPGTEQGTQFTNCTFNVIQEQTNVANQTNIEHQEIVVQQMNLVAGAVDGLEKLQEIISGAGDLPEMDTPDGELVEKIVGGLPFGKPEWEELEEDEREEISKEYSDRIFASKKFSGGELDAVQLDEFNLTEEILDRLSPNCRAQIICGIRVYDLLQMCIDEFNLEMTLESPRGILFARAFECHLRDCVYPFFSANQPFADFQVSRPPRKDNNKKKKAGSGAESGGTPGKIPFKEYPVGDSTIGTYTYVMNKLKMQLKECFKALPGDNSKDEAWVNGYVNRLNSLGTLRNDCCHSNHRFMNEDLKELIDIVFIKEGLEDTLLFREM